MLRSPRALAVARLVIPPLAEFEWRSIHRFDLAAMIPALGRGAVATKPQPYWWLKMADYGAQSGEGMAA